MERTQLIKLAKRCIARGAIMATDANEVQYRAYEYISPSGNKTHIDADLVEWSIDPEKLVAQWK